MASKLYSIRPMTADDLSAAFRLSILANWNQLKADWAYMIEEKSSGNFVGIEEQKIVGSVVSLHYSDQFSWIGMMLVDPEFRRRGLGNQLMKAALKTIPETAVTGLDATPMGKGLYEQLGFKPHRQLWRMLRDGTTSLPAPSITCAAANMLPDIVAYDQEVFGASRATLFERFLLRNPAYGFVAFETGSIGGFCLGRSGLHYEQIGPVVARTQKTAQSLLLHALEKAGEKPVVIDVFEDQTAWTAWLNSIGFQARRPLLRMYRGTPPTHALADHYFAIAGPEFG